ncbi:response regulator transcription factor [Terrabacter koreensis]|jgi:DNA-binding NarL/FixJ family response regulator
MSLLASLEPRPVALDASVRVLVVDDHEAVAWAIGVAIGLEEGVTYVGSSSSAAHARRAVADLQPDVVVMDVNLGDEDGIELAAELIRDNPQLHVIVLTGDGDEAKLRRAADAGVGAFLFKDGSFGDVLGAIRAPSRDGLVVHPKVLREMLRCSAPAPVHPPLTVREKEVLTLLSQGQNVASISGRLGITRLTCRGYVKNLLAKLQVHSQLEAVATARRFGLIGP